MKHLTDTQLHQYLDGSLSAAERCHIWEHLQTCSHCDQKLRREADLRRKLDLRRAKPSHRSPNLNALLPTIMTEARRPPAFRFNHQAALMGFLLTLLMILPFFRRIDAISFAQDQPLLNVPMPTETLTSQMRGTQAQPAQANLVSQTSYTDNLSAPISISQPIWGNRLTNQTLSIHQLALEYASPVPQPQPQATRVASVEPPH